MKEVAFVLKHRSPTAVIIMDELCRGTNGSEAIDICYAVCQQLLVTKVINHLLDRVKQLLDSTRAPWY